MTPGSWQEAERPPWGKVRLAKTERGRTRQPSREHYSRTARNSISGEGRENRYAAIPPSSSPCNPAVRKVSACSVKVGCTPAIVGKSPPPVMKRFGYVVGAPVAVGDRVLRAFPHDRAAEEVARAPGWGWSRSSFAARRLDDAVALGADVVEELPSSSRPGCGSRARAEKP